LEKLKTNTIPYTGPHNILKNIFVEIEAGWVIMNVKEMMTILQGIDPEIPIVLKVYNDNRMWNIHNGDVRLEFPNQKPTIIIGW
jgi:hypothetical protein